MENLFAKLPSSSAEEHIQTLLETRRLRIERIVSNGQASPAGFWYDQAQNEWVLLVQGTASVIFESGNRVDLQSGDYLLIEKHVKHRVERTSADAIWLAVHYEDDPNPGTK